MENKIKSNIKGKILSPSIRISIVLLALLLCASRSALGYEQEITGTAKNGDKIVYIEKHTVKYSEDNKLQTASTHYESTDGILLATLVSDFTPSITVPNHISEDLRSGEIEGVRREGEKIILFRREKNKEEETRTLTEEDTKDKILVGCQGLNYYVLANLDDAKPIKDLQLRFLFPGKLDYYDFDMNETKGKDAQVAEFEIGVKNWFLRIFAPKLHAKYDRKTKQLVWYHGLSNIKNDKGGTQKVTIEYQISRKLKDEDV